MLYGETQFLYNNPMPKNKRLTILLPDEIYDKFQDETAAQYTTMSEVTRRLILEWLASQQDRQPPGRPKTE